jgi:death-on-curing family protein
MINIKLDDVENVAHGLAQKIMEWDEPIPPFVSRFPNKLESCLATPFQTYGQKPLYRTLVDKSAILFYLMIKNYPFKNGNKRIAVTTLLCFLAMNDKWISVDAHELYTFSIFVAESPAKYQKEIVEIAKKFIRTHLTKYSD